MSLNIMMTSSNGNIFRVTGTLCGDWPIYNEFPTQRPVKWSFAVFFDLHLNKWLSKQSWCWWFETPSRCLWHHCNDDRNSRLCQIWKEPMLVINWGKHGKNPARSVNSTMWTQGITDRCPRQIQYIPLTLHATVTGPTGRPAVIRLVVPCKTAVTPLLMHWSYCNLVLSQRDVTIYVTHCGNRSTAQISHQCNWHSCTITTVWNDQEELPWVWTWWRYQMETFSTLLAICAGNSPVPSEFTAQRPVTRSFAVFFNLRLNKPLSKQWWGWWFKILSRPLWRHCNEALYVGMPAEILCDWLKKSADEKGVNTFVTRTFLCTP